MQQLVSSQRLLTRCRITKATKIIINYCSRYSINNQNACNFLVPKKHGNNNSNVIRAPLMLSSLATAVSSRLPATSEADHIQLPAGLVRELMPRHVAVILDGNRRWCKSKGLPISYAPLYDSCMTFAQLCAKWGIPVATFFNFGTSNWKRPKEINELLFRQFQNFLGDNLEKFRRKGMRISVIGEISRLPNPLQETIQDIEEATKAETRLHLIFAVSYGGQRDIVQAATRLSAKISAGVIQPQDIDESLIEKELWTTISGRVPPDPDLMIRTSGEIRISNFLLWQMAYTELYFTDVYWPDFDENEFLKALLTYQNRARLYGD